MVAKEIAVKKYVVKLSAEERERLDKLIHSGKRPARQERWSAWSRQRFAFDKWITRRLVS